LFTSSHGAPCYDLAADEALFSDVRASLPAGTPAISAEQRERLVRERRAALQQRPLW
jgi:hypothetical protein